MNPKKELSQKNVEELLVTLKARFLKNMGRHEGIDWKEIEEKLRDSPEKLWSLYQMEKTGGEPDVISLGVESDNNYFCDFSAETPKERRNVCYDQHALESRKEYKPKNSAINMANEMGVELMDEYQYRALQKLGEFDAKTSSWLKTPDEIRSLGGAIFGDRRYDHVFVYHNGASSYYASRGFRVLLKI